MQWQQNRNDIILQKKQVYAEMSTVLDHIYTAVHKEL